MTILPKTIYLAYPEKLKARLDRPVPDRLHLRGCTVIETVKSRGGDITRALISSEYDALDTIVLEMRMVEENGAIVEDVSWEPTV